MDDNKVATFNFGEADYKNPLRKPGGHKIIYDVKVLGSTIADLATEFDITITLVDPCHKDNIEINTNTPAD